MSEVADSGTEQKGSTLGRILKVLLVVVPAFAAIPTLFDLYTAITEDVPFWEVRSVIRQGQLAQSNWLCQPQMKYSELADLSAGATSVGSYIYAAACPKSGDTHVRLLNAGTGVPSQLWISYTELSSERRGFRWTDIIFGPGGGANAAEMSSMRLAQAANFQVMCIAWVEKKKMVQIVKEGTKCFKEEVSPMGGKVLKREEAACDMKCPESTYKPN